MRKHILKKISLAVLIFTVLSNAFVPRTYAAYSDNPNVVYYDLSRLVYKGSTEMNNKLSSKFKVIDFVDVNQNQYHPMGTLINGKLSELKKTGFKAAAVVIEESKKLFIVFAGSSDIYDWNTAGKTVTEKTPGQEYQAQLYTNYIYKKFPKYQGYNWYFTGHSLGGWLAVKDYLDIRSANWVNDASKFKYGGAIGKSAISGVYTFNPLPISYDNVNLSQWNANQSGTYNSYIKNLYIENEWLNGVADMYPSKMAYFGTKGSINTGIQHYSYFYIPLGNIQADLASYYVQNSKSKNRDYKAVTDGHSISNFSNYVH
ncbi:hypothetical protein ACT8ZR_29030 [Neobacillus sp. M.A.Huq-85]